MGARVSIAAALLLAAGACGAPSGPTNLYTVTSDVMQKPGELPHACAAIPLPYPPIGCGGVDIGGLDLSAVRGVTVYRNGVRATGTIRLVGSWDGRHLNLSEPPEPRVVRDATPIPLCAQRPGTSSADPMPPVMARVKDDDALLRSNGVMVLEFGPCNGAVFFGVAVADRKTVDFLTRRYGHVEIGGWLQPVR